MTGDTHNFGLTVPALFAAHEKRYHEAQDEITRLRAENEALRADAERYRWLRTRIEIRNEQAVSGSIRPALSVALGMAFLDCKTQRSESYSTEQANKLDAAIDAAKGNQHQKEKG